MNDPLIYIRAVHFAATIMLAGVVFFVVFIAEPALQKAENPNPLPGFVRPAFARIAWVSLVLAMLSGAAWLVAVTQSISDDQPLAEPFSKGAIWTMLFQTGFGRAWLARFVLACLLGGLIVIAQIPARNLKSVRIKALVVALATGLVGTLTFAGHAVGDVGMAGIIHPAADFLHLVAAAAWLGTLVPLVLVFAAAGRSPAAAAIAQTATVRFSTLGVASVATLLATGSINTWYLVGSVPAFTGTPYGRLLLAKVALFLAMVAIAAINRLRLTPRLVRSATATPAALRQLRRNATIEVIFGAIIIAIVAVLGVTPPSLHGEPHAQHSH